jgi:ubiquinone/menaquinone biosynthesis C-methylase UbiE
MNKNEMNSKASSIKRLAGKGVFPPKYAFTLLFPLRNIFISPRQLIERMDLKSDSIVLEVGPGPGYFSAKIAPVLHSGKLFLTDIQQEMLDYAKKRLSRKKINNVEFYLCNGSYLPFSESMFDVIFMVTVLGEIENKRQYIKEFYRVLRKNGILSISEQAGDPDKMEPDEIKELLIDSGFIFDRIFGTNKNFTINFRKEI